MKKILPFIITISLIFATQIVYVSADATTTEIEYLDNGYYIETVIETVPNNGIQLFSTSVTKSKTSYYKNSAGTVLWYVKVTGTFTYGGGTSKCTSASASAASSSTAWKVSNIQSSRVSNKASATATGKQYLNGTVVGSITKTVTLTCSSTGVFS